MSKDTTTFFVLMPFDAPLEPVYTNAIKPAVEAMRDRVPGLTVFRADRKYWPNKMEFIREHSERSVNCILSGKNLAMQITGMGQPTIEEGAQWRALLVEQKGVGSVSPHFVVNVL